MANLDLLIGKVGGVNMVYIPPTTQNLYIKGSTSLGLFLSVAFIIDELRKLEGVKSNTALANKYTIQVNTLSRYYRNYRLPKLKVMSFFVNRYLTLTANRG